MTNNLSCIHLIDSADWSLTNIERLWSITRFMRDGKKVPGIENCLNRKTIILLFCDKSTRSRLSFNKAIIEMGGVPIFASEEDLHNRDIEDIKDLAWIMALSSSAICIRTLPKKIKEYGEGEKTLRLIANETQDSGIPVISISHDRCHPCQGLSEMLTIQDAIRNNELKGIKILYTWVRGKETRPWSPTQDSLMIATRIGMKVTLCHPKEYSLDPNVIKQCHFNAYQSGGEFVYTDQFDDAFKDQDVIYARHWSTGKEKASQEYEWYCDTKHFNPNRSFFIHPMPCIRGVEVASEVAESSRSLLKSLILNKYYLQKAVLAITTGCIKLK